MSNIESSLNFYEKVIFKLRRLFSNRGYSQYKMSKFEEYDLYARNKDFLISDSVITFTDTNGKLMALKPDVTLSIIKNSNDCPDAIQKVYYDENVYRIAKGTNTYKELMQVGLECFGDIDNYSICEVITLACESLKTISQNCVLDLSHIGIVTEVFEKLEIPSYAQKELLKYISEKNTHQLINLAKELELDDNMIDVLKSFISLSGKPESVLSDLSEKLSGIIDLSPINELDEIIASLNDDVKDMVNIDFSVVSDTHYYNGIVFKGFIKDIPNSVLTGGQYDKLMQKMKRKSGAIGFAVYLDVLDNLYINENKFDVDIILLYDKKTSLTGLNDKIKELNNDGYSVFACKNIPENIKYDKVINITKSEVDNYENNA